MINLSKLFVERLDMSIQTTYLHKVWVEDDTLESGGYFNKKMMYYDTPVILLNFKGVISGGRLEIGATYTDENGKIYRALTKDSIVNEDQHVSDFSIPTRLTMCSAQMIGGSPLERDSEYDASLYRSYLEDQGLLEQFESFVHEQTTL